MAEIRPLLCLGNGKVGESIHTWSLPAEVTCPGASDLCRSVCYAKQARFRLQAVIERLAYNFQQCQRPGFVTRMVNEIRFKCWRVIRIHVSGDFFSKEYAEKWLAIMKRCPRPRYYWYSRSWRVLEIAEVLERMSGLKQVRCWYSIDAETGVPVCF